MQRKSKSYSIAYEMADKRQSLMSRQPSFTPPTDVIELPDKIMVVMEVAGMRSSDLNITLVERHLIITGKRERPQQQLNPAYHQVEIGFGEFRVEIDLPWAADRDTVSATYEAGFLEVELPRKPTKPIRIVTRDE